MKFFLKFKSALFCDKIIENKEYYILKLLWTIFYFGHFKFLLYFYLNFVIPRKILRSPLTVPHLPQYRILIYFQDKLDSQLTIKEPRPVIKDY